MGKKYRIAPDLETGLLRIIALEDFSDVKEGDWGGLIAKKDNLSQEGDCWVYYGARVSGNAKVCDNATVYGQACVYDNARICDNAKIYGHASVGGEAQVYGDARVYGYNRIDGKAQIYEEAEVYGNAGVYNNAKVYGKAKVSGYALVSGNAQIFEEAKICGGVWAYRNAKISGDVTLGLMKSITSYYITTSIKNNKDYNKKSILLAIKKDFYVIPINNLRSLGIEVSTSGQNYLKNVKTIRQLYGEKV